MRERAHKGHLVGVTGHLREDSAQLDAGDVGLDRADSAAVLDGSGHLGVESFDLGGTAAEPEPDDRGGFGGLTGLGGGGTGAEEVGQHQTAHAQGADLEEVATGGAVARGPAAGRQQVEHDTLLS